MKLGAFAGVAVLPLATACVDQPQVDTTGTAVEALQHFQGGNLPNNVPMFNPTGFATTVSTNGGINLGNEFFQDLGTNGRRCVTCHLPTAGWTVTPPQVQL